MEREAETYAFHVGKNWNAEDEDEYNNDRDLEKGQWDYGEYNEKESTPYYATSSSSYTVAEAATDIPLIPSAPTQSSAPSTNDPRGDAVTESNEYYPSTSETEHVEAQAKIGRAHV